MTPHVRLVETSFDSSYQYIALSHCWALTNPLRTTARNLSEHTLRVPWNQLSLAIRQAVEYIWIDSLCILQDNLADWESELPRTDMIYSNAFVVFAAHGPTLVFEKLLLQLIQDPNRPEDVPMYCRSKIDHQDFFSAPSTIPSWYGRA